MKSSKPASCFRPYWRRNSLKRGTPRSRSRMMSSAATSMVRVGVARRSPSARFCRNCGWFCSVSAPSRWRPRLSAQLARPTRCIASVAPPRKVSITGTWWGPGRGRRQIAQLQEIGQQRMQAVDGDELLREVEGRAEVVDAAIDVVGLRQAPAVLAEPPRRAAGADDPGAGGEHRVPLRRVGLVAERPSRATTGAIARSIRGWSANRPFQLESIAIASGSS